MSDRTRDRLITLLWLLLLAVAMWFAACVMDYGSWL